MPAVVSSLGSASRCYLNLFFLYLGAGLEASCRQEYRLFPFARHGHLLICIARLRFMILCRSSCSPEIKNNEHTDWCSERKHHDTDLVMRPQVVLCVWLPRLSCDETLHWSFDILEYSLTRASISPLRNTSLAIILPSERASEMCYIATLNQTHYPWQFESVSYGNTMQWHRL